MTLRQCANIIIEDYIKTRSIDETVKNTDMPKGMVQGILWNKGFIDDESKDLGVEIDLAKKKEDFFILEGPEAFCLHLEVDTDGISDCERKILMELGKSKDGTISRDITIPSHFTLHQLNYAIQAAFGWKNTHMHNFTMDEGAFERITQSKFKQWRELCGVYFRFPDEDDEDLYWDDDYGEDEDLNKVFATRYIGPYVYGAMGDYYLENQQKLVNFIKEREVEIGEEVNDLKDLESFEERHKNLIESLKVSDVLIPKGRVKPTFEDLESNLIEPILHGQKNNLDDDLKKYGAVKKDLFDVLKSREKIDELISQGIFDVVTTWNQDMDEASHAYQEFVNNSEPPRMPVADCLRYDYDFGDGWNVKVTFADCYYDDSKYEINDKGIRETKKLVIHNSNNEVVDEKLTAVIKNTINNLKPYCIEVNGLNLIDDIGGIDGFINMLKNDNGTTENLEITDLNSVL
jgi:hypothetical protein